METKELPELLTVPWVLAEVASDQRSVVSDQEAVVSEQRAEGDGASLRPFHATLAATGVWVFVVAGMVISGAMFPLAGNVAAYLVLMAGLYCIMFMLLTCPRSGDEQPETFWTMGSEPAMVGQCTPSRVTLTGRE